MQPTEREGKAFDTVGISVSTSFEGGAELRYISELLGHVDPKTTQVYAQVSIRQLKLIHSATHPATTNEAHHAPRPEASDGDEPSPAGTVRHDDDVVELLDALEVEAEEEREGQNPAPDEGRRSAAGDTAALDTTDVEENDHDHERPRHTGSG